jgi:hypothetical protein
MVSLRSASSFGTRSMTLIVAFSFKTLFEPSPFQDPPLIDLRTYNFFRKQFKENIFSTYTRQSELMKKASSQEF